MTKLAALLLALTALGAAGIRPDVAAAGAAAVRVIPISYRAHDGLMRRAYVIVPADYGRKGGPPIPLVISPTVVASAPGSTSSAGAACRRPETSRSSTRRARDAR